MIIAVLMNIQDAMAKAVDFGINQRQRFLTKCNRIIFGIERRTHTVSRQSFLPSNDSQCDCGPFLS
jgi:hypothetical protein